MKVISSLSNINFEEIFLFNFVNEMFPYSIASQSIIVKNKKNEILHG